MLLFGFLPTEPWDILLTPSFWWFVVFVVALIIVERVISWAARRAVTRLNLPREAANNLIIVVRIIIIVAAITVALPLFGLFIPSEIIVALTASLATAIGLFIAFSLSNTVAGIYMLITRPFSVGDYVKIGDTEGIVEEISINYTIIYTPDKVFVILPNQIVLHNQIVNYKVRERAYEIAKPKAEEKRETPKKEELETRTEKRGRIKKLFSRRKVEELREAIKIDTLHKYTFDVRVRFDDYRRKKTELRFDEICRKWEPVFGYSPSYMLWIIEWHLVYRFTITVEEPIKIIEHRNALLDDILEAITAKS
ncbi:MAG: mechanosensitive ion channel domain-containing protein [Candidatus Lokiarchaeia archaeon]